MAHSISSGGSMQYTCTGDVLNGALLRLGSTTVVAMTAGATGDQITVAVEGVFSVAKKAAASTSWAQGGRVYQMTTGTTVKATGVAAAGVLIGHGHIAAATGDTTGTIKLLGGPSPLETQT